MTDWPRPRRCRTYGSRVPLLPPDPVERGTQPTLRAVSVLELPADQARAALGVLGAVGPVTTTSTGSCVLFDRPDDAVALALVASGLRRERPALVVWLDEDEELVSAGFAVVLDGELVAHHVWGGSRAGAAPTNEVAAATAAALRRPEALVPLERLLQRHDEPRGLVGDLAPLVGVTPGVLQLLLHGGSGQTVRVRPIGRREQARAAYRASSLITPLGWRGAVLRSGWWIPALVSVIFLAQCALAPLGEDSRGDAVGYAAAATVAGVVAVLARRRARRRAAEEGPPA